MFMERYLQICFLHFTLIRAVLLSRLTLSNANIISANFGTAAQVGHQAARKADAPGSDHGNLWGHKSNSSGE
jgi:hypothetical protein